MLTGAKAKGLAPSGDALFVEASDGETMTLAADKILVTVGRKPATEGWGLEAIDLDMDGPFIRIDDQCRTSMRGVYAIGDVTGEPMLAHRASAQGEMVAEIVAGRKRSWDKVCIPAVCFTDPEIVTAGLSPEEAEDRRHRDQDRLLSVPGQWSRDDAWERSGLHSCGCRADNHLLLGIQARRRGHSGIVGRLQPGARDGRAA